MFYRFHVINVSSISRYKCLIDCIVCPSLIYGVVRLFLGLNGSYCRLNYIQKSRNKRGQANVNNLLNVLLLPSISKKYNDQIVTKQ
jgi:hypothetical protein